MINRRFANQGQLDRSASANILPSDPRYAALNRRNFNKRFEGKPDYFRLVGSTEDVIDAVQHAVRSGLRLAVRSGGHCLEGFVADLAVRVVIDMSPMSSVSWDAEMKAFAIEGGTTLGDVYRKLYMGWGVLLPAGQSPDIGIGGHALGSSFGFVHREHGLAVDYLYAVEVVGVDEAGNAKSVIATREASDPNRELWWAHTGGGGGNFGIVTRYWFRARDTDGSDPAHALPTAPASVVTMKAEWSWKDIDERAFTALLRNFGEWCERNSDAKSPNASMFSVITAARYQPDGRIELRGMSIAGDGAERQLDEHVAAVAKGVGAAHRRHVENLSWPAFAVNPFPDLFFTDPGGTSASQAKMKGKDALMKVRHTDRQLGVMYRSLTAPAANAGSGYDFTTFGGLGLATYGGRVNSIAPEATAAAQRGSIMATSYSTGWMSAEDEASSIAWVRDFYGEIFADTGGVPAPGATSDGALINHPDPDLADPKLNTSGVPWHAIYYQENYPRLQRVKAAYDPRNIFHHALSIRLPDA